MEDFYVCSIVSRGLCPGALFTRGNMSGGTTGGILLYIPICSTSLLRPNYQYLTPPCDWCLGTISMNIQHINQPY